MDEMFKKPMNDIIKEMIQAEMEKAGFKKDAELEGVAKRKFIFTAIFSIITFILISLLFFHLHFNVLYLEAINVVSYYIFMKSYTSISFLMKEVKSRPDEEIAYIVSSILNGNEKNSKSKSINIGMIVASIVLPCIIFCVPHMMYEKTDGGYDLRFYTKGLLAEKTIEIPAEHKGEAVVGIRGDVFAELKTLEEVILPDTITSIRGCAFENCSRLVSVQMPKTMEYLGGSAFSGCYALRNITLPEGLSEIKGNTFYSCDSLEEIVIPEGVTRIAGHAFYNCGMLESVSFPSTLQEIGSSAFRECYSLKEVVLPFDTVIDERSFKDSPTEIYYMDE